MAFIARSIFQSVPLLAGVPYLLRHPQYNPIVQAALGSAQNVLFDMLFAPPVWGIFDKDGYSVLECDSILTADYTNDGRVSTAPIQEGSFAAYDKIDNPDSIVFVASKGGTDQDRALFFDTLKSLKNSFELFDFITPETKYENLSIESYSISRRSDDGVQLVKAEIRCTEIRQNYPLYAKNKNENARSPNATPAKNRGQATPIQSTAKLAVN